MKPCIVFIEDFDCLFNEDELVINRIVLTELMVHIQGIGLDNEDIHVILSASKPWTIQRSVLRRYSTELVVL